MSPDNNDSTHMHQAPFSFTPSPQHDIYIKVVGVGGGGSNAVNHMYDEGIHDVSFAVCNTDKKALEDSPVPFKLQLGADGLGAGNDPRKAQTAFAESSEQVKTMLDDGTKMVFITAGMGGGTGTGAAPLIAKMAKEMGILTVGIVTIPFKWEGTRKIAQALDGVEALSNNVDALLVVNNQRLLEIYRGRSVQEAFAIADDTLCNAAKSISGIITMRGHINLDFQDVETTLKDGGVAIINSGYGSGEGRLKKALDNALNTPLLKDNQFFRSKKVLLHICAPSEASDARLMVEEMDEVADLMNQMQDYGFETKWGLSFDDELQDKVKVTVLASGFGMQDIDSDDMQERLEMRTAEERQQEAQAELKRQELEKRIGQVYGTTSGSGLRNKPVYTFIFEQDDLDNDDIISAVETSATCRRNFSTLEQFTKHRAAPRTTSLHEGDPISFNENI